MKTLIAALFLAGLYSVPALADVYKCRNADGGIEISNSPCASGASTLKSRPDEKISETERQRAEKDVERMRDYVEKRESAQRADAVAERQAAAQQAKTTQATPRVYGSADECLRDVGQMGLDSTQRSQVEADCRRITTPQTVYVPYPVAVPAYGRTAIHPNPTPVVPPVTPPKPHTGKDKILPIYEATPPKK